MTLSRSAQKQAAILDAARDAFRAHGFQATTMDAVADQAGVSKRTVYNHFTSKELLFTAVIDDLHARIETDNPLTYAADEPLDTQLKRFAHRKLSRELEPDFVGIVRAIIADVARMPGLGASALGKLISREDGLVVWLRAAHTDGRLYVPYPQNAAHQFWALAKGAAFWPLLAGLCEQLPGPLLNKAIDESVAMLLDHYRVR
ncbi:MAG: TetR/AcrR family transcriptional regulator of autoinduction and epiphytic fitness [Myxococcota bacterium]|jgi:TetR/AcrR family transcriptional regulator of autoinduction and epiphytic fitness